MKHVKAIHYDNLTSDLRDAVDEYCEANDIYLNEEGSELKAFTDADLAEHYQFVADDARQNNDHDEFMRANRLLALINKTWNTRDSEEYVYIIVPVE